MNWVAELRQRKVFRVAAAYAVVGWLLVQVAAVLLPALRLPSWTVTFTTVLLLLGFPVALVLAWSFDLVRDRGAARGARASKSASGTAPRIVVLPFANLSEDAPQTHLADALVEDLTTRLQSLPGLGVVSRQSAYAYHGKALDARTIASELGCRYVVEGSVRRIGERIRVNAQLIDGADDVHLWAERFDRRLEDAFALQDEMCDHIVAAVQARLQVPAIGTSAAAVSDREVRPEAAPNRRTRRLTVLGVIAGLAGLVGMAALLTWTLQQRERERWAREEALPQLEELVARDEYEDAFVLGERIRAVVPNDPRLRDLARFYAVPVRLQSEPAGARAFYRPYDSGEGEWRLVGSTPIRDVPLPRGPLLWRLEHPGRAPALLVLKNPSEELRNVLEPVRRARLPKAPYIVPLPAESEVPAGMVYVPASTAPVSLVSYDEPVTLPAFFLDRFEVTNREYKEFVDAGGYTKPDYWSGLEPRAIAKFVDETGRPGPATWVAGTYRDGTSDHPVGGVSWYEAAAYARFRGKELPTAWHWYRAAFPANERVDSLSPAIITRSNFSGKGTAPVGRYQGVGPYGTYDMAGNVREWLWNEASAGRWIAGGAYNEPPYLYNQIDAADPLDRSPANGIRCMQAAPGPSDAAQWRRPIIAKAVDLAKLRPVDDEAYAILEQQLAYNSLPPLDPKAETIASTNPLWRRERIHLATGYDDSHFPVELFLPSGASPPFQVVFFGLHSAFFNTPVKLRDYDPTAASQPLDFILRSGRALAVIGLDNAFERSWPPARRHSMSSAERRRVLMRHWRQEFGRTIDYFETRRDLDSSRIAYYGVSWGAQSMLPLLAVERRIDAAVLVGGGVFLLSGIPQSEQAFNYLPRVRQPVLMLNGRWDVDVPLPEQKLQLELLGAPAEHKRHVLFEAGHGALPHNGLVRATLEHLDRYLGPSGSAR